VPAGGKHRPSLKTSETKVEEMRMGVASEDRLFPLNFRGVDAGGPVTGVCADGRQVVMGLLCPNLVAYFFDPKGDLLHEEHRSWLHPAPRRGAGPYQIYDEAFQSALATQFQKWQQTLGFNRCAIQVRAFLDERYVVGIELFPDHLQPTADEWQSMTEQERQDMQQARAKWKAAGTFVWWWAEDYWINPDGTVGSN
jgi:hypothetical protein